MKSLASAVIAAASPLVDHLVGFFSVGACSECQRAAGGGTTP